YLTLDDGSAAPDARERAAEYCHELVCVPHRTTPKFSVGFYAGLARNLVSPLPYFMQKYRSAEMRKAIVDRIGKSRPDVLVCDFLVPSINVPAELPLPAVLFQHNVEAMIWRRHYEVQTHPVRKAYLRNQWEKARNYEREECRRYDRVVAVSADDRVVMEREYGLTAVDEIPTGVDTEYFRPSGKLSIEPNHLVFTGSMDWLPNEDAIRYFTAQILPLIRLSIPDVRLTVVGRNPFPGLIELSKRDPAIVVTGRVDDVRPYIERAAAYVIPLRIGGGTRLKVYEALAMERPLISTTVGAEGLPVSDGEELLLADTPENFAAAVVRVLHDRSLASRLGTRAAATVRERFGWDRVAESFADICRRAARVDQVEMSKIKEKAFTT
ncbi:MAG: glycosyltransferase, partial [Blastocatellia bacterium]|nr:glycosyltransferase [Blastocatellia bacterium]